MLWRLKGLFHFRWRRLGWVGGGLVAAWAVGQCCEAAFAFYLLNCEWETRIAEQSVAICFPPSFTTFNFATGDFNSSGHSLCRWISEQTAYWIQSCKDVFCINMFCLKKMKITATSAEGWNFLFLCIACYHISLLFFSLNWCRVHFWNYLQSKNKVDKLKCVCAA